ncbi:MAG TPA: PadR family transcriptional regulator [Longimicrobiales bacterium]|nr:PadR family transcriptional regulator [Longimicrobiales bacterium]
MTTKHGGTEPTLSYNAAVVLQALSQGHRYGFEIMRAAHLPSGTVYPLLRRLEASGLVASRWEGAADARREGRPPRRYYEATPEAASALAEARERVRAQQALFGDPSPAGGTGG